jgi:hypothetical protein
MASIRKAVAESVGLHYNVAVCRSGAVVAGGLCWVVSTDGSSTLTGLVRSLTLWRCSLVPMSEEVWWRLPWRLVAVVAVRRSGGRRSLFDRTSAWLGAADADVVLGVVVAVVL